MNDTNAFERLIADVTREAVGPTRPVDVEAIARSAAASSADSRASFVVRMPDVDTPRRDQRGFSMFTAAKLVAAVAIISVSGAFLVSGVVQPDPVTHPATSSVEASDEPVSEPSVPAWVTGLTSGHKVVGSGGRRWVDGRTTYPEEVVQAMQLSPDPRLEGTMTMTYNLHELGLGGALSGGAVGGGGLVAGSLRIENEDGAWQGTYTGMREPDAPWSQRTQALLDGEGDYEGLRALLLYDGTMGEGYGHSGSQVVEGFVFEGAMPEVPAE